MATLVPCNQCQKLNRVSLGRAEAEKPVCGACGNELLIENGVAPLSGTTLQHLIERSPLPIVVDFWSPTCVPCRSLKPEFARSAKQFDGRVVFASLNIMEYFFAGDQFRIRGIPTLIYFSGGKEIDRKSGLLSSVQLNQWLESILKGDAERDARTAA
jgi:thioredoxin 2